LNLKSHLAKKLNDVDDSGIKRRLPPVENDPKTFRDLLNSELGDDVPGLETLIHHQPHPYGKVEFIFD
jgi:hypothetical protein